jgi:uncharacterized protein
MSTFTSFLRRQEVVTFCVLTLILTFAAYFLPFPPEARALGFSVLVVFIPALVAIVLTAVTDGFSGVKDLLSQLLRWRLPLKWLGIAVGVGIALRLGVSLAALLLGWNTTLVGGTFSPFLIMVFIFAAGEEIGWRGYALPRLLKQQSPLAASLLLGVPWAALHLILLLPGMLSEGAPPVAQFLIILALAVLLTWVYIGAGRNGVVAAILLHGTQNLLSFINTGIDPSRTTWLMAAVYTLAAIIVVVADLPAWMRLRDVRYSQVG